MRWLKAFYLPLLAFNCVMCLVVPRRLFVRLYEPDTENMRVLVESTRNDARLMAYKIKKMNRY